MSVHSSPTSSSSMLRQHVTVSSSTTS
jgi:hypothetical protein